MNSLLLLVCKNMNSLKLLNHFRFNCFSSPIYPTFRLFSSGLPDKDYGEVVYAIVVPDAELKIKRAEELKPALSLHELLDWAKERLTPYKVPSSLFVWDSLPRNVMGKVSKKDLKRKLAVIQNKFK